MKGSAELIDIDAFESDIERIVSANLDGLVTTLSQLSYVGATGELSRSWEFAKTKDGWIVVNTASESLQRVVGVPPGTPVTPQGINNLQRWVEVVLGVSDSGRARSIARTIATNHNSIGSERYRSEENFLMLSVDGKSLLPGSPALETADNIISEINGLVLRSKS